MASEPAVDNPAQVENGNPDLALTAESETRIGLWLTVGAVAFVLLVLGLLHAWTTQPDGSLSNDAPYHIAMADLFGQAALGRTFPWTQRSIWRDHFYDKELGFHFLLMVVRRWAGLFGYRGDAPPFLLEDFSLIAAWLAVFLWALWRVGIRQPYVFVPLAVLAVPLFTYRLNLIRPHVLSSALMVATAVLLCPARRGEPSLFRTRFMPFFALGILFAYCYSNPHFVLVPTVLYAVVFVRAQGRSALLPAVGALAGVLAGFVVHPQFPNTFIIWKIQCVDVVWQALTGAVSDLTTAVEVGRPTRRMLAENGILFLMAAIGAGSAVWEWRRGTLSEAGRLFALLAVLTACGVVLSQRVIEYAVPFTVMAVALAYDARFGTRGTVFHARAFVAVILVCLALLPLQRRYFSEEPHVPMPRQFAEWCRVRLPPGTCIANLFWDDFPRLFFTAPEYRYTYAMDPMFGYAADPVNYPRLEAMCAGKIDFPPGPELQRLLGARLVYVSPGCASTARRMAAARYALPYQGLDGWCFDLEAPPVDHSVGRR